MGKIVDFEGKRRQKQQGEIPPPTGYQELFDAVRRCFTRLPESGMTMDALDLVQDRVSKLLLFTTLLEMTHDAIEQAGLDPNAFELDELSFDLYLHRPLPRGSMDGVIFNGPYFYDISDDCCEYRAVTTFHAEDGKIGMAADVLRLEDGAANWEIWIGDEWREEGPPDQIFEALAMETIRDMIEEVTGEDMLDDDDDDPIFIDELPLPPAAITRLMHAGVISAEDLADMTEDQLRAIPGIGKKTIDAIKLALREVGLQLSE